MTSRPSHRVRVSPPLSRSHAVRIRRVADQTPLAQPAPAAEPETSRSGPAAAIPLRFEASVSRPGFVRRVLRSGTFLFGGLSVLALGASAYLIFFYNAAPRGVTVSLDAAREVYVGAPFVASIVVRNDSEQVINAAELSLILPPGVRAASGAANVSVVRFSVGDLPVDGEYKKEVRLLLVSATSSVGDIVARLVYAYGHNDGFETEDAKPLFSRGSALELSAKTEEGAIGGASTFTVISYRNVSNVDLDDVRLNLEYPKEFVFLSADPAPDSLNNYWKLGGLRHGSEGLIRVRGRVDAAEGAAVVIPASLAVTFDGVTERVAQAPISLSLSPSPFAVSVLVNGSEGYRARIGDLLTYRILYTNSTGVRLDGVSISATLRGDLFDPSSLVLGGGESVGPSVVRWSEKTTPALSSLDPGASGEVRFSVRLRKQFPIERFGDKDFSVFADVAAESPTVPYYLSGKSTRTTLTVAVPVSGAVAVDAQAFFRDARAGIANAGSVPPRVGTATEYTIHWFIKNFATDAADLAVRAALPSGVRFTGVVKSVGTDVLPEYDEVSGEAVWRPGSVPASTGVLTPPLEGVFQVALTPEPGSAGKVAQILGQTKLSATDAFTGAALTATDFALNTTVPDDQSVGAAEGVVME